MWTQAELEELQSEIELLAGDYPFLASEASALAVLIGDAIVDASPPNEDF